MQSSDIMHFRSDALHTRYGINRVGSGVAPAPSHTTVRTDPYTAVPADDTTLPLHSLLLSKRPSLTSRIPSATSGLRPSSEASAQNNQTSNSFGINKFGPSLIG